MNKIFTIVEAMIEEAREREYSYQQQIKFLREEKETLEEQIKMLQKQLEQSYE